MGKGTGEDAYSSMLDCFRKIVAKEGPGRLYRGILPPILVEAPKRAVKFSANEKWGSFWRMQFKTDKMTQGLSVLTGASAGATEAFVVVPFELVKIRLQDKANAGRYSGTMDAVKKIVASEGPLALFNGLEATLCRHITWNAGYFGCIQGVRAALPPVGTDPATGKKIKSQELRNSILAGSIGGFVGTVLNTPFDVVKSRIQNTTRIPGQKAKYNWAIPSVVTVGKEEGFSALYKGFAPKVLRLAPGGGLLLVVFDTVSEFFRAQLGEEYA